MEKLEKFTDRSNDMLHRARVLACEHGLKHVDCEHLVYMLASLHAGASLGTLKTLGVEPRRIRSLVLDKMPPKQDGATIFPALPLSEDLKKAIGLAHAERITMKDKYVGTGHLLLGILQVTDSYGALTLNDLGVTYERVSAEVHSLVEKAS